MEILVTGSEGFIGKALIARLLASGHTVTGFDAPEGDIAEKGILDNLKDTGIGYVFHLAAKTFVPESWNNPFDFYRVNLLGTTNVLEFCRATGAGLSYISSYLYGTPGYLPVDEKHPLKAHNPYSHSKIVAEETCRYYRDQFKIPVTIFRPFNIYGPGQDQRFLIPKIIAQ
ncbi:MAG TPA: SDR family oxidoreductase, partial [Bacteroidales bacterium]|nr:SDR family oxidoreductase [Bacteroidales bacterium]